MLCATAVRFHRCRPLAAGWRVWARHAVVWACGRRPSTPACTGVGGGCSQAVLARLEFDALRRAYASQTARSAQLGMVHWRLCRQLAAWWRTRCEAVASRERSHQAACLYRRRRVGPAWLRWRVRTHEVAEIASERLRRHAVQVYRATEIDWETRRLWHIRRCTWRKWAALSGERSRVETSMGVALGFARSTAFARAFAAWYVACELWGGLERACSWSTQRALAWALATWRVARTELHRQSLGFECDCSHASLRPLTAGSPPQAVRPTAATAAMATAATAAMARVAMRAASATMAWMMLLPLALPLVPPTMASQTYSRRGSMGSYQLAVDGEAETAGVVLAATARRAAKGDEGRGLPAKGGNARAEKADESADENSAKGIQLWTSSMATGAMQRKLLQHGLVHAHPPVVVATP